MRTLEGASVMLITTAVVLMLVSLPVGLSLSSSIISNNTVTTDQPIGDAPFNLPNGVDYKTEYKDGKWEISKNNGPFSSGEGDDGTTSEVSITFTNAGTVRFYIIVTGEYEYNHATVNSNMGFLWAGACKSGEGYLSCLNNNYTISDSCANAITITVSDTEDGSIPCYSYISLFCYSLTPVRMMIEFIPSYDS